MSTRFPRAPFRISLATLALVLAVGGWFSVIQPVLAQKPTQKPGDFYLSYVAATEKMESIKDVLPFMPADQAAMMSKIPKDMEKEMLEDVKKELVTNVKVLKESPYKDGVLLELEGTQKATSKKVKGWAQIVPEGGAWKLAKDDWSGAAPPAPPKIPATMKDPGKADGEFTVNGQTAKLLYARAAAEPDSFDKTQTAYRVTLSDVPWNPKEYNQNEKVKAGTLHYIDLSIGGKNQIYGTMLHHRGFQNGFLSSAGSGHTFEAEKLGPDVVAGRAFLEGPQSAAGETFYYAATFRAPVEKASGK
jgi:hypothetical protein